MALLNPPGTGAQFVRSWCAISGGILKALLIQMQELQEAINYIDWKQDFYDDVLSGKTKYFSNLIKTE